ACLHGKLVLLISEHSLWCTWLKKAIAAALKTGYRRDSPQIVLMQLDNKELRPHVTLSISGEKARP
ncbi:MAG TPA: hypothetical protein VH593_01820, partial [Ktedonobacteraceae bacterium]